jgi:diaminopimelate decarboxylase
LLEQTLETCLNITKKNNIKIHFSLKSNFNDKILKILSSHKEIGADCVSGGEVNLALKYFKPESIVFAGIGKTDEEIEEAVDNNIFCLNVESIEELDNLNEICKRKKKRMNFATRINPNVLAHTHEKITTGLNENKFGIFLDKYAENFYNKIRDVYTNKDNQYEYLNFIGLHFHIGSQILNFTDYLPLCEKIDEIIGNLSSYGVHITYLNLGGGLGVDYDNPRENPIPDFQGFFDTYLNNIKSLKKVGENFNGNKTINLHFELGRSIICQSGNLIAKVNYIKQGIEKKFMILDAGMNDLIRPAMYGALHQIEKIGEYKEEEMYDVVGPICESSDVFAKNYTMGKCSKGDLVMIRSAGAYGESMASRYNYRNIPQGYLDTEF